MLEELKSLMDVIKDMPHMVMWVLAGLLFYKCVIVGSWFGICKLVILKLHDWLTKPKKEELQIGSYCITSDQTVHKFKNVLLPMLVGVKSYGGIYIHESDVDFAVAAIQEKKVREKQAEASV